MSPIIPERVGQSKERTEPLPDTDDFPVPDQSVKDREHPHPECPSSHPAGSVIASRHRRAACRHNSLCHRQGGRAALGMYIGGEVAGGYAVGCARPRCAWRSRRLTERMTAVEERVATALTRLVCGSHLYVPEFLTPMTSQAPTPMLSSGGHRCCADPWRTRPGRRAMPSCAIRSWCTRNLAAPRHRTPADRPARRARPRRVRSRCNDPSPVAHAIIAGLAMAGQN